MSGIAWRAIMQNNGEQAEPRDPPAGEPREHPPHEDEAAHRRQHERQAQAEHRAPVLRQLAGVPAAAGDIDRREAGRDHPERQDRLAAEALVVLRPLRVHEVVVLQHHPPDLAVVRLPRIDERVRPDPRGEDGEGDDRDERELEAQRAADGRVHGGHMKKAPIANLLLVWSRISNESRARCVGTIDFTLGRRFSSVITK
jgi:hypothetical protein